MLNALLLALRDLAKRPVQRLLWRCVLLALATFIALVVATGIALAALDVTGIAWLDTTLAFAGSGLAVVLAWLLFPATVVLTLNLFAEQVVAAVERLHYPDLPPARGSSLATSSLASLKLAALALILNLLVLPLYFLPGANVLIFLALNGYLVGREYFEVVAGRRLPPAAGRALKKTIGGRLWLAGALVAIMLTIPVFNLVAPVVGTAFMVHLFERWRRNWPARFPEQAFHAENKVAVRPTRDRMFDFAKLGR
jgi:CysZ protein